MPRATRVAALIRQELHLDTDLEPGRRGEFTVWVDGKKIVEKSRSGFPSDSSLIASITDAVE